MSRWIWRMSRWIWSSNCIIAFPCPTPGMFGTKVTSLITPCNDWTSATKFGCCAAILNEREYDDIQKSHKNPIRILGTYLIRRIRVVFRYCSVVAMRCSFPSSVRCVIVVVTRIVVMSEPFVWFNFVLARSCRGLGSKARFLVWVLIYGTVSASWLY